MDIQKIKKTASNNKELIVRRAIIVGGVLVGLAIAGAVAVTLIQPDEDVEVDVAEDGTITISESE